MRTNRSVIRALDILNLIAATRELLTITEISKALDMPKTSAFEILYALVEKGYLEIGDQRLKTFKLGINAFQIGISYLEKTDLRQEARPLLQEMMEKTKETVFLVTESNGRVVYLDKVENLGSVRTSSVLGSTNPMHCTGVGKALLAAFSDERVQQIIEQHGLLAKTAYSITTYPDLVEDLAKTRKRGYAIDDRESELEVFCVAAPIYNMLGQPIGATSIASLLSRMLHNPERIEELGRTVNTTALLISRRLGFRGRKIFPEQ